MLEGPPPVRLPLQAALAPSFERRRLRAYLAIIVGDSAILYAAFALAGILYIGDFPDRQALLQAQLMHPLFLTIALYQSAYSISALTDARFAIFRCVAALIIAAVLLNFIAFYARANTTFSRATLSLGILFAASLMAGWRMLVIEVVRRRWAGKVQNVLIVDSGGPAFDLPEAEHIDAGNEGLVADMNDPHALDRLGRVLANQDRVIVSCSGEERERWTAVLKAAGVNGEVLSEPAHRLGAIGLNRYEDADVSALIVSVGPLGLRARAMKRMLDLAITVPLLVALGPLIAIIALAIKLEDSGPVFFRQSRMGQGNRFFSVLKFRSMRVETADSAGTVSASRGDTRVTRVGAILRKSSLDELPQLLNVLRGTMSLVGPRPHAIGSQAGEKLFWEVDGRYWHRHALKPGMTGLAQVRGFRGATEREADLSDRLQADLEYLIDWSPWRDLAILFRTAIVLRHDRAY